MAGACPSTWEVETSTSEVQGHPPLHSEAEASLGYMRPGLKDRKWREGVALLVTQDQGPKLGPQVKSSTPVLEMGRQVGHWRLIAIS